MVAPYNPPVKNEDFIVAIALTDTSSGSAIKKSPTIVAGDFQISKDFGTFANLTTLPTESPAGSGQVKITLSATEMNADNVTILGIDASGNEWADFFLSIPTTA